MYVILAFGIILYFVVFAFVTHFGIQSEKIKVIVVPAVRNKFTLRFFKPATLDLVLERITENYEISQCLTGIH